MEEYKRTVYDAVQENLKVAGRKTYLHRIICIGEHKYDEPVDAFKQYMVQKIKRLHDGYCDEVLTGFLLAYPMHFIHLIEGSEVTLMTHLQDVCEDDGLLGRMKVLLVTYHINQRFFSKWGSSICHPPILFEKLDPECSLQEMARQSKICISKIFRLSKTLIQQSTTTLRTITETLSDKYPALLPECALLDFLLGSNTLRDLRKYTGNYRQVFLVSQYDNLVWPVQCEYIPTNVLASIPVQKALSGGDEEENEDDLRATDTMEGEMDEGAEKDEDKDGGHTTGMGEGNQDENQQAREENRDGSL